jgi:hypothetical protein
MDDENEFEKNEYDEVFTNKKHVFPNRCEPITLTTTLYYYMKNVHYYMNAI